MIIKYRRRFWPPVAVGLIANKNSGQGDSVVY